MKKREVRGDPSIKQFIERVYKAFGFWCSELKARLLEARARHESWGVLVFENGIVRETIV